jgi:hypothetical protein
MVCSSTSREDFMNRKTWIVIGLASIFAASCGGQSPQIPSALTAPSSIGTETGSTGRFTSMATTPGCNNPNFTAVSWDKVQFGRATVTNLNPFPCDYTFIGWLVPPTGSQVNWGQASIRQLASGATAVITVGGPMNCGQTLQRDIYGGIAEIPGKNRFTASDVANYFVAGDERFTLTEACAQSSPPPPPVCSATYWHVSHVHSPRHLCESRGGEYLGDWEGFHSVCKFFPNTPSDLSDNFTFIVKVPTACPVH